MDKPNEFLNNLRQSFILVKFKQLKSDFSNIDEIFANNINIWYYFQSDNVTKIDGTIVNSKIDTINNSILLNPKNFTFSKSNNGFELSENDFIDYELKTLKIIKIEKLSIREKKQFLFYIDFLKHKINIKYATTERLYQHKQNNDGKIYVWQSEYELRQFIHTATRWSIKSVFESRTEKNNYSIFDYEVKNSRKNFELFCTQLNNKLIENNNWRAIEIDIKDRFLDMINQYSIWYKLNSKETEKFNPDNPYEFMFSIIESTKKEILKYFPDIEQEQKTNTVNGILYVNHLYNEMQDSLGTIEQQFKQNRLVPQQIKISTPDKVIKELHNNIFKDNAFELFEEYHSKKNLAENCKTDLNLLFQLFQKDNLFVETVELKHYIKWLNNRYSYSLVTLKRVNIKSNPNTQRTNDYNEYKKTTLKQP